MRAFSQSRRTVLSVTPSAVATSSDSPAKYRISSARGARGRPLPEQLKRELPTAEDLAQEFPAMTVVKLRIEIERALREFTAAHGVKPKRSTPSRAVNSPLVYKSRLGARPPRKRPAPVAGKWIRTDETPLFAGFAFPGPDQGGGRGAVPQGVHLTGPWWDWIDCSARAICAVPAVPDEDPAGYRPFPERRVRRGYPTRAHRNGCS